ncbi:MAG: DUF3592 domain-containing protein [Ramlibacter sp.]
MNPSIVAAMVVGSLFLIGLIRAIQTHLFIRRAVRVRATVVDVLDASVSNPDTSSQSSPTSRYVVEIVDRGKHKRRVALADAFGGSIADKFVANDGTIAVLYDPKKPGVIRIDSPWALYFIPFFLCTPGVLVLALIIYVWLNT